MVIRSYKKSSKKRKYFQGILSRPSWK
jgi:hypothetical protein